MIKIGLLDFGVRAAHINSISIIEDLIDYACKAEELGYNRFWLSEHHNFDPLSPWLNPEVLLPVIAGMTNNIRIGTGGILLANHSPYRIAYTFKLLNNLFSNRIDLGIAKGYSSRNITNPDQMDTGLSRDNISKVFDQNLLSLLNYLNNEEELLEQQIIIPPYKGESPEIWALVSSYKNLKVIAAQGINFSRSIFHYGADVNYHKEQLHEFREIFFSAHHRFPKVSIAFSGCCHKDEQKARKLFEDYPYAFNADNIVGSPSKFEDTLCEYQTRYDIDEFIFMNVALNPEDRQNGIELLSEKMQLKANV
ncbi:LLM class flavin-dependent oxidoreductase [Pedobacter sp. PAMC26386]|nr:LLM class flavin-dependent oxidoreductase [Pedobacter sp. PAMC26386]